MITIPVWLFILVLVLVFGFSSFLIASFAGTKYFEYDELIKKLKEENKNIKSEYAIVKNNYIQLSRHKNMINTIAENVPEQIKKQSKI